MVRLTFLIMLVVVGMAWADEQECSELADCDCGSVCNAGKCEAGCMVFDQFLAAGSESEVYGRMCECGADGDEEGRPIMCAENVEFEGQPEGVDMYVHNTKCDAAAA